MQADRPREHGGLARLLVAVLTLGAWAAGASRGALAADGNPPELQWGALPPLPDPEGFAGMFAGTIGDALLVAGGANFPDRRPWDGGVKRWYDAVWLLEDPAGPWRRVGSLPRPSSY